ncbi:MAG: helix-turn-helix domain-containing protein [Acidimicrobiales bacterium]
MTTATPTKQAPADAVAAALAAHPGATAADLAEAAGIGRSTAAKALAALERHGGARRSAGGRDCARRIPDRWYPAEDSAGPEPDTAESGEAATSGQDDTPGTKPVDAGVDRLGKGALRTLVFDYLAAHAGQIVGLGPTAVAKALGGRSSGAVGNALRRLEADGRVRLVTESPRRYRAIG